MGAAGGQLQSFTTSFSYVQWAVLILAHAQTPSLIPLIIHKSGHFSCRHVPSQIEIWTTNLVVHVAMLSLPTYVYILSQYSATSIIWTSFIRNLDYPDLLETSRYISMHEQRAWPMKFQGVWRQLNDDLDSSTDLSWSKLTDLCIFMNATDHDHTIQISFKGQVS